MLGTKTLGPLACAMGLALLCLTAGCEQQAPEVAAPQVQRVAHLNRPRLNLLRPADFVIPPSEVALHLTASAEAGTPQHLGPELLQAGTARLETVEGQQERHLWLQGGEQLTVRIAAEDAALPRFDEVLLRARFHATATVQAIAHKAGNEVLRMPPIEVILDPAVQLVSIPMPRLAERSRTVDEVLLDFVVVGPGIDLFSVDFLRTPIAKRLPPPDEEPGTLDLYTKPKVQGEGRRVALISDGRPVHGLISGAPQGCRIEVQDDYEEIRISIAQIPELRALGQAPRVRVLLMEGKTILHEHNTALENHPNEVARWHDFSLPLEEHRGKAVRLRVDLMVGEGVEPGNAICGVTQPMLIRRNRDMPTVLLVTSDTHRADHLAAAPASVDIETPVLDALAARGVLFSDAWATTNVTSPSHVALMTGLHPRDSGVLHNTSRMAGNAATLAESFRAAGWSTLAAVSVRHLGPSGTDLAQGFERMVSPPGAPWDAQFAVSQLEHMLDQAQGQPVFAWLHVFDAHVPYDPPEPYAKAYWTKDRAAAFDPALPDPGFLPGTIPLPLQGLRDLEYPKALYRGEVSYLDSALGPLLQDTRIAAGLVAFTSDHGEILAKDGTYFNHGEIFPDTLHVPLILAGWDVPQGVVCDTPVRQMDLGRSLLDLASMGQAELPGTNLLFALDAGETQAPRFSLSAYARSAAITDDQGLRRLHLILHLSDHGLPLRRKRLRHTFELYDLRTDPECLQDLTETEPKLAIALRGRLIDWLQEASENSISESRATNAEALEQLRDLGYAVGDDAPAVPAGATYFDPDCNCDVCARISDG